MTTNFLEVRKRSLDNETQYVLDHAHESNEIDYSTYIVLYLYGNKDKVKHIAKWPFNEKRVHCIDPSEVHNHHKEMIQKLLIYGDELLNNVHPVRVGNILHHEALNISHQVLTLLRIYSNWAITDFCEGGCLENFKKKQILHPTKRIRRKLHSQKWIHRYIKRIACDDREVNYVKDRINRHLERVCKIDSDLICEGFESINKDFLSQRECTAKEYMKKHGIDKKVAKRSALFAEQIIGSEKLRDFVRGKYVTINGKKYNYQFKKNYHLTYSGHGSLDVNILDFENDVLANSCIYVEDTPSLDQLVAFFLHIKSGNEDEIIQKGNHRITPKGKGSALYKVKEKRIPERYRRNLENIAGRIKIREEDRYKREKDYWNETKDKWIFSMKELIIKPALNGIVDLNLESIREL